MTDHPDPAAASGADDRRARPPIDLDDVGTLSGDIRRLRSSGFGHGFSSSGEGMLHCPSCHELTEPGTMEVAEIVRYEGESNPEDESILVALVCPCGTKGYFTSAFGSAATAADALVLARFT